MCWTAKRDRDSSTPDTWHVDADGRALTVEVKSGAGLLTRLERAVLDALGVPVEPPSSPRYRVTREEYSHGDLFELEQDTIWRVVDVATGQPLLEWRGGTSHHLEGGGWSEATSAHGIDDLRLSVDGLHALVRDSDVVTCRPPSDVLP